MITIDGITIPKVVSVECNHDTSFMTCIQFYYDTRIDGCVDMEAIDKYDPMCIQKQSAEEVGVFQIIINKDCQIDIST